VGEKSSSATLGFVESGDCPLPTPIELSRGVKVDAVVAGDLHTLALEDDASVYTWGSGLSAGWGALGWSGGARVPAPMPHRVPALRVPCGL
jgi:alpha-tubulin suppressor-like RCC1 family protein